ncbi:hypothetical protein [Mucilaginibacter sp.]
MKKIIHALFIAIAILGVSKVRAQTTDTVKTAGWFHHQLAGAAQIQVTYRPSHLGQLNQILNNNGIQSLGANDVWINASMSHIHGRWLFEDGIGFTPITTANDGDFKAQYNQYQLYTRAGYNFSEDPNLRLFPFVGLNFSAAVLNIQDNTRLKSTDDFSSEILNSTSSKTFYQPNFGIELGAGMDYLIKVKPKNMGCFTVQRNIPIGLRAGYYINAAQGDWRVGDNYSLQDGPNRKQSAIFVSFNIGLGYEVQKQ